MSTENKKRSIFGFHGVFGILISIVGLILIWAVLMTYALLSQRGASKKPYDPSVLYDGSTIEMNSIHNKDHAFMAPKK